MYITIMHESQLPSIPISQVPQRRKREGTERKRERKESERK
jgi:hypothetical protein